MFAGPYGIRLVTNSFTFHLAFGEPQTFWQIAGRLVDFAAIVPALLLFEEFYGKGWRSSVRWLPSVTAQFAGDRKWVWFCAIAGTYAARHNALLGTGKPEQS